MMDLSQKRLVFISYGGSVDAQIANLLSEFLGTFLGCKAAVYCTASYDNRTGAHYGDDFSESYMKNIKEAIIFIPLLSENYMNSTTTLIELGAAYALGKKFIPFLVSDCDYEKIQPLYNIRNNDMHRIDDYRGFKKAMEEMNRVLKTCNSVSDEAYKQLMRDIKKLKSGYKTNIYKQKQVKLVCNRLFEKKEEYESFIKRLGNQKIIDICITNYTSERVCECNLYFKDEKTVFDLVKILEEQGILDNEYSFIEIEG